MLKIEILIRFRERISIGSISHFIHRLGFELEISHLCTRLTRGKFLDNMILNKQKRKNILERSIHCIKKER
jgi:hypothetical protein